MIEFKNRADDPRIARLIIDVSELKFRLAENSKVTKEVRDILTSFRIVAGVSKWVTVVGAGIAVIYSGVQSLLNSYHHK